MRRLTVVFLTFLFLLTAADLAVGQTGRELFQQAVVKERANGDMRGAIEIYERIAEEFADDRELVARALVQMGQCYERLGLTEAREVYQRVIDDFPEQRQEVATAQQRLASLVQALAELRSGPTFRKIEIASKPRNGVLSPDGSRLAFVSEGGVWLVPLHGNVAPNIAGQPVRIADVPDAWDNGSLLSWSANGEWIAVNSFANSELFAYVVPANGGAPRLVDLPNRMGGGSWNVRLALSPTGERLAFSALEPGLSEPSRFDRRVYVVPTAGGEPERLSSEWSSMPAFSADGEYVAYVGYRERSNLADDAVAPSVEGDLWVVRAAGGTPRMVATLRGRVRGPVWSPDGLYIAAHLEPGGDSDSRELRVFPVSGDRTSSGEPISISLPRSSWNVIAGWTPDNELGVFLRTEEHMAVYTVPASGGRAVQTTPNGYAWYPRWSVDGQNIYFRSFSESVGPSISYARASGGEPAVLDVQSERPLMGRVPGGGFNISPDGERMVLSAGQLPFRPEEGVDIWLIPLGGGHPERITSDPSMEGYPAWSPDGQWIAFTDGFEPNLEGGVHAIYVSPAAGGQIRRVTSDADSVGGGAITFSPDGERIVFFSENAIKTIPIAGGQSDVLVRDIRSGWQSQLAYSPDGSKIAHSFAGKIWITSLDDGESQELRTGLPDNAALGDFDWSPDGSQIAFVATMGGEHEFWLISDFLP
jgi:Tol biopolymer transport system component